MSERERLVKELKERGIIYSAGYAGEIGGWEDLADFILEDRRRCLDEVEKILKEVNLLYSPGGIPFQFVDKINEALSKISELRKD